MLTSLENIARGRHSVSNWHVLLFTQPQVTVSEQ